MLICTPLAREQFAIARALPGPKDLDPGRRESFDDYVKYLDQYGARPGEAYAPNHAVFMTGEHSKHDAGRYFNLVWYRLGEPGSCTEILCHGGRAMPDCKFCGGTGRRREFMFSGALVYHSDGTWSTHT